MAQFDRSSKWLIQHHGDSLLRLAGIEDIVTWKAVHSELAQPGQLPDGLIEAQLVGEAEPDLFLVEMTTYPERRVIEQLVRGSILVFLSRRQLPESLAIVLRPKGRFSVPRKEAFASRRGWTELGLRWRVVELWKVPAEPLLTTDDPGIIPWVPLCHYEGDPQPLMRRCHDVITRTASPEEVPSLLAVTQILAKLRYNDPALFEILGGRTMFMESPIVQELLAERQVETMQRDILRILAIHFGPLPLSLEEKLRRIQDEKRLETLFDEAVRSARLEDFRAQLD